jgi:hypothetical protein
MRVSSDVDQDESLELEDDEPPKVRFLSKRDCIGDCSEDTEGDSIGDSTVVYVISNRISQSITNRRFTV